MTDLARAAALGRELRPLDDEARVRELARVIANERTVSITSEIQDGYHLVRVKVGDRHWGLKTEVSDHARAMILAKMVVCLVHELVGCDCRRVSICPAWKAFYNEADRT